MLVAILGAIHYTHGLGGRWRKFYSVVPVILMCYLLPSLLTTAGIISSHTSQLWPIAKDYFLPAALVLLTLSIDFRAILGLGPKALTMFLTGTVGIVIGGPIAILIVSNLSPGAFAAQGENALWRGLATLSGSWIGGGANQTAMLELYGYNMSRYSAMVAVDIVVANLWMAFLLYGAGNSDRIDRWLKADTSAIEALKHKVQEARADRERIASSSEMLVLVGLAFGGVGFSHLLADIIAPMLAQTTMFSGGVLANKFFWVVVTSTTVGLAMSFTSLKKYEDAGASKLGGVFIFLLVAIIGTKMNILEILDEPITFLIGMIWMLIHIILLFVVAKAIRAPFFYIAVGSKANVGGAASAPIVAGAFHPSLAPVGVLLAVLGYALGTYGAILCAELMQWASP